MSEYPNYRLHDLRRFGILHVLQERALFPTTLSDSTVENQFVITMTAMTYILATVVAGAVLSSTVLTAERRAHSKGIRSSIKVRKINFLPLVQIQLI
jgi:hypothetical protein